MRWATIIPLIGGQSIGTYQFLKEEPEVIASFRQFKNNERYLKQYWPSFNYKILDKTNINLKLKNIDFINTLCPCAGLSELNSGKDSELARGVEALQNNWMYLTAEYVLQNVKPKVFYGENTDNLFSGKIGSEISDRLYKIAVDNGYSFSMLRTDARFHGLPQKRIRTFYFFWNSKRAPSIPINSLTTNEDLGMFLGEDYLINEQLNKATDRLVNNIYYKYVIKEFGQDYRSLYSGIPLTLMELIVKNNKLLDFEIFVKDIMDQKVLLKIEKHKNKLGYWDDSPIIVKDYTNSATSRNINTIHPTEERILTLGEWIKIMGMPPQFLTYLSDRRTSYLHLFQNVPVDVARDVARYVVQFINGDLSFANTDYVKQDWVTTKFEDIGKFKHSFF